ncbi:hypothetical protein ACOMHN_002497 [Nucella lapillus]
MQCGTSPWTTLLRPSGRLWTSLAHSCREPRRSVNRRRPAVIAVIVICLNTVSERRVEQSVQGVQVP